MPARHVVLAAISVKNDDMQSNRPAESGRHCGGCVACCDGSLRITVDTQEVKPGTPCPHCTGTGCAIYERRPRDPCQQFICGWLARASPLPEWMRPDRAGLLMLAAAFQWRGLAVDVAVPTGTGPTPEALEWLRQFSHERRRPLVYQLDDEWYAHGPPEFQRDIKHRLDRGEKLW